MISKSSELRDILVRRAALEDRKPHRSDFAFKSYEAFVIAYGKAYESAPLDFRERAHVEQMLDEHRAFWRRRFAFKHCFRNSQELLCFDTTGRVVYVEGYVWAYGDRLPPVHHAWLTLHGRVIDVTVVTRAMAKRRRLPRQPLRVLGDFEHRAYLGVPFLRSHFAFRRSLNRGHGSLLDDADADFPLLRQGGEGEVRRRA